MSDLPLRTSTTVFSTALLLSLSACGVFGQGDQEGNQSAASEEGLSECSWNWLEPAGKTCVFDEDGVGHQYDYEDVYTDQGFFRDAWDRFLDFDGDGLVLYDVVPPSVLTDMNFVSPTASYEFVEEMTQISDSERELVEGVLAQDNRDVTVLIEMVSDPDFRTKYSPTFQAIVSGLLDADQTLDIVPRPDLLAQMEQIDDLVVCWNGQEYEICPGEVERKSLAEACVLRDGVIDGVAAGTVDPSAFLETEAIYVGDTPSPGTPAVIDYRCRARALVFQLASNKAGDLYREQTFIGPAQKLLADIGVSVDLLRMTLLQQAKWINTCDVRSFTPGSIIEAQQQISASLLPAKIGLYLDFLEAHPEFGTEVWLYGTGINMRDRIAQEIGAIVEAVLSFEPSQFCNGQDTPALVMDFSGEEWVRAVDFLTSIVGVLTEPVADVIRDMEHGLADESDWSQGKVLGIGNSPLYKELDLETNWLQTVASKFPWVDGVASDLGLLALYMTGGVSPAQGQAVDLPGLGQGGVNLVVFAKALAETAAVQQENLLELTDFDFNWFDAEPLVRLSGFVLPRINALSERADYLRSVREGGLPNGGSLSAEEAAELTRIESILATWEALAANVRFKDYVWLGLDTAMAPACGAALWAGPGPVAKAACGVYGIAWAVRAYKDHRLLTIARQLERIEQREKRVTEEHVSAIASSNRLRVANLVLSIVAPGMGRFATSGAKNVAETLLNRLAGITRSVEEVVMENKLWFTLSAPLRNFSESVWAIYADRILTSGSAKIFNFWPSGTFGRFSLNFLKAIDLSVLLEQGTVFIGQARAMLNAAQEVITAIRASSLPAKLIARLDAADELLAQALVSLDKLESALADGSKGIDTLRSFAEAAINDVNQLLAHLSAMGDDVTDLKELESIHRILQQAMQARRAVSRVTIAGRFIAPVVRGLLQPVVSDTEPVD